jgi:hypothetical protein
MQKIKKFLIPKLTSVIIFMVLVLPIISLAAVEPLTGLVPCNNSVGGTPCDFNALMAMVNKVIIFILYGMAVPIAAIMFAYAGFLLVTAGGEAASARTKAKNIFTNAIIGLIIAVAAFLIVKLILSILGYQGDWIGFPLLA